MIETQHHVLGTEVNQGQEATEASGRGQIEDLMARAWSEHQRDPVLVGEGPGRPIVLDEKESAVGGVFVEQDRVLEAQGLWHSIEPTQIERHQHIAAFGVEQLVGRKVD